MQGLNPPFDVASSRPRRRRSRPSTATGRSRVQIFRLLPTRSRFLFLRSACWRRRTVDPGRLRWPITRGAMDCSKKSKDAVCDLPDDSLVEILSRVPAKSVCRFKCVSKAWRDLISHPDHRKKLRQAMQGLFFLGIGEAKGEPKDDDMYDMCAGFIDLLTARSVPRPCFSFLREQLPGFREPLFLDSCNGLILFYYHPLEQDSADAWDYVYVVCNPTTKQWGVVPFGGSGSPEQPQLTHTKLAFDPAVSSHFYLVEFVTDEEGDLMSLRTYSSETGIWSHNHTDEPEDRRDLKWLRKFKLRWHLGPSMPDCAFLNGFLHYMVSGRHLDQIVALDVQGKARRMIKAPTMHPRKQWLCHLDQSQGQLHYMIQGLQHGCGEGHRLHIWVLRDYEEEWELKDVVNFSVVFDDGRIDPSDLQVVCMHPDRNVVFFNHALRLIAYDMDRKEATVVSGLGEYQHWHFARFVPCFLESPSLLRYEH